MTFFAIFYVLALLMLLTRYTHESKIRHIICRRKSGKWGRCIIKQSPCPGITHLSRVCNSAAICCVPESQKVWDNISYFKRLEPKENNIETIKIKQA